MSDFICIYQTLDFFEANLIKSRFDAEGIFCVLRSNDASGTLPHLGFSQGGTEVMVPEEDLEVSKKILKELKES